MGNIKNNTVIDRTVYTDFKHEAWAAALNILAVEFLIKTDKPRVYGMYCDILNLLDDGDLEVLHGVMSLNHHITSLGHMCSHDDYESVQEALFGYLNRFFVENIRAVGRGEVKDES